MMLKIDYFN